MMIKARKITPQESSRAHLPCQAPPRPDQGCVERKQNTNAKYITQIQNTYSDSGERNTNSYLVFVYFGTPPKYTKMCVNSRKNSQNGPKFRAFYAKNYASSNKYTTASCVVVTNINYALNHPSQHLK